MRTLENVHTSFKNVCKYSLHDSDYGLKQKPGYLKTNVKSKALSVIKQLELLDQNYKEAWILLDERFGNEIAHINAELKAFQELQPIRDTRHLGDYKKLAREVLGPSC